MRVGTSKTIARKQSRGWDHPHACGDKQDNCEETKQRLGSSPCVWGQVRVQLNAFRVFGIIPMRVGTSLFHFTFSSCVEDHPHACGDKMKLAL